MKSSLLHSLRTFLPPAERTLNLPTSKWDEYILYPAAAWRATLLVSVGVINTMMLSVLPAQEPLPASQIEVKDAILKTIESTTVAAQAAGVISTITAKEGHNVKLGQELGRIRDAAVRLQVEKAKATVELARRKQKDDIDERLATKSFDVASNEYQRALNANKRVKDSYPINEIDRLKLVADRCQLEIERAAYLRTISVLEGNIAETEYKQALELYERHRILCPVNGVVVSLEKHDGEWVEPGTALLKIERIDRLRVEGFISAQDSIQRVVGRTATVTLARPSGPLQTQGQVVFVSPSVDPILSTARLFIEIENPDNQFRPGLGVKATILFDQEP